MSEFGRDITKTESCVFQRAEDFCVQEELKLSQPGGI